MGTSPAGFPVHAGRMHAGPDPPASLSYRLRQASPRRSRSGFLPGSEFLPVHYRWHVTRRSHLRASPACPRYNRGGRARALEQCLSPGAWIRTRPQDPRHGRATSPYAGRCDGPATDSSGHPSGEDRFGLRRVFLDPVDGLSAQAGVPGDC